MLLKNNIGYVFDELLPTRYWNNKTRIEFLQRRIIVFSIMYYELNESIISDKQFDDISHQLVEYMNTTDKEILEQTQYYYVLKDFDGSTGFYIYDSLNEKDKKYLTNMSKHIISLYKGENKNGSIK